MKTSHAVLMLTCACVLATPALAQFRKPEDAIKYRQSVMFTMATHFYSRLGPMVNGRVPFDAKAAAEHADVVAILAKLPWPAFGPGTDLGNTDAKPAVWTEQAKFKEGHEKLVAETAKLAAAAKTGNLDTLKTAFASTAGTCKACHDSFRAQ